MVYEVTKDVMNTSATGPESYKTFVAVRIIANGKYLHNDDKTKLLMCKSIGNNIEVKIPTKCSFV